MTDQERPITDKSVIVIVRHEKSDGGCGEEAPVSITEIVGAFTPDTKYGVLDYICPSCGKPARANIKLERARFKSFGDESSFGRIVAYGFVTIFEQHIQVIEEEVIQLKNRFRIESNAELHCRIVFNEIARNKSNWRTLSEESIFDFAKELLLGLKKHGCTFQLSAVDQNEYPSYFPAGGGFPQGEMGSKQLAGVLFQGAALALKRSIGIENTELIIDPDRTKIPWFDKKIPAQRNYQFTDPETQQLITPKIVENGKAPLLEVADLFVYVSVHALTDDSFTKKNKFKEMYKICEPIMFPLTYEPIISPQPSSLELRHSAIISGNE